MGCEEGIPFQIYKIKTTLKDRRSRPQWLQALVPRRNIAGLFGFPAVEDHTALVSQKLLAIDNSEDLHINIRMHGTIPQIVPHTRQQHLDPLPRPMQPARQQRHAHSLHAIEQILLRPHPNQLLPTAARPRVQRPVEVALDDVDEADVAHPAAVVARVGHGAVERFGGAAYLGGPLGQRVAVHGAVDAADGHLRVLQLEDAAGPEGLEGRDDDLLRVAEAREERAPVHVVEFMVEEPGLFGVGDLEAAVCGDAGWVSLVWGWLGGTY